MKTTFGIKQSIFKCQSHIHTPLDVTLKLDWAVKSDRGRWRRLNSSFGAVRLMTSAKGTMIPAELQWTEDPEEDVDHRVANSPPTCISSPGVWEPQSDYSLRAARDKRGGGEGMRENRNYTITSCWGKHTIHFLNQVALISSKARRWAGSRAFSVPGEVCCWGNDSRENVLSITSSMYLKQSEVPERG